MKRTIAYVICFLTIFCTHSAFAFPKQIIIIRHSDKLAQAETGPTLSAKGEVRAIEFAFYYLNRFGEPDYIIATKPVDETGKNSSIRELQTVAPLANMLAERYPNQGFPILHPYKSSNYDKLAKYILPNAKFDDKTILICWNHKNIPLLTQELGVKQNIPEWGATDFNTVYILRYNNSGHVKEFEILRNQYPVANNISWKSIINKFTLNQK